MVCLIIVSLHSERQHLWLGASARRPPGWYQPGVRALFLRRSPAGMCVLQATEEAALARRAATTVPQGGESPPSDPNTREAWSCGSPPAISLGAMEALHMRVTQAGFWTTFLLAMLAISSPPQAQQDPGPRPGAEAGDMLKGLSGQQKALFQQGREEFVAAEEIAEGLGPRFNLDSCAGCHAHPAVGGSSPPVNPQVAFLTRRGGAANQLPTFVRPDGPMVEIRFKRDDKVHQLFAIEAQGCALKVGPFPPDQVTLRIPTPTFGLGLVEQIPDTVILAQRSQEQARKQGLGIGGVPQQQGDGRMGRFGWKAQHGDLEAFAGEAYNVEMGITNELNPTEIEPDPRCQFAPVPNSLPEGNAPSAVELFAAFMRGLAPPAPPPATHPGRVVFDAVGCGLCHTPSLGGVPLFSDLLLHTMGTALDDSITQGVAQGQQFRTAPLWGVGQRLFFLHDGRTSDLVEAINAHASSGSEANGVIAELRKLTPAAVQDLLNFLRAL